MNKNEIEIISRLDELEERIDTIESTVISLSGLMEDFVEQLSKITEKITAPPRQIPPSML